MAASDKKLTYGDLLERKELARKVRRPFERDWWLNLAYVSGEQYVEYSDDTGSLVEVILPDGTPRITQNICMKITRIERAKLLKTMPIPKVLPATTDQDDVHMALALEAYFRQLQDEWKFDRRLRTALFWTVTTGNAFLKWYWGKNGNQLTIVPPFDMYLDPHAKTVMDARWAIHSQFMDMESAREKYNVKGAKLDFIKETKTDTLSTVESRVYANFSDGDTNLPGVVMNEYWEPPRPGALDKGRYIVFTNGGIVYEGPFPYRHGKLPFTHIGHIERSNSKYYAAVLDFIRPIQQEINRTEVQLLENRNMANGKWYLPVGLELEEEPTAQPRQILRQTGGNPQIAPQVIEMQALPAWVQNEPDRLKAVAEDLAGQHEVSNGAVPGRVESGQAIQLLQEMDDAVIKDTVRSMEEAISDGFTMAAELFKQYGDPEEIVRVYDRDGRVEAYELKRDALKLEFRVKVQTTTGLPQTIAGRWDRVLLLFEKGIVQDPNLILELLDMAPESPELVPNAIDRNIAWRENKILASGTRPVQPNQWDNHAVHLAEHDRYRKTTEFDRLTPEIKQMFEYHVQLHKEGEQMFLQEQQQKQMLLMPPDPNAAPPAGGPAPAPIPA